MPLALLARCPEPRLCSETPAQRELAERIDVYAEWASRLRIEASFGLELRAAFVLDTEAERAGVEPRPPYRQFLLRPAIEPILFTYLDLFRGGNLDPNAIDGFVSCLHGAPVTMRQGPSRISPNARGHFVQFPDCEYARDYCSRLNLYLPSIEGAVAKAAYAYAEVLLSHPYADGNGRLARALAVACLSEGGRPPAFLPLGPAFYAHAPAIASALQALAVTADWRHFLSVFADFLEYGLALGQRHLSPQVI